MVSSLYQKARSVAARLRDKISKKKNSTLTDSGSNNTVEIGENIEVFGSINGDDNVIIIEDSHLNSHIKITLNGNRNRIHIGKKSRCKDMSIHIGTYLPAHETKLEIGDEFSSEAHCKLLLYNSGNVLRIGQDCMFANHIIVRCGESPHLIFDSETGDYLDTSEGVFIGNHVWVGEQSYITKRCTLPDNSILAACSVATRRFDDPNVVIAGNPAQVVRKGVKWLRNRVSLEPGSPEKASHDAANAPYKAEEDI
jgi:acetyltransferase-like isoleucine patch superfamily enzyme